MIKMKTLILSIIFVILFGSTIPALASIEFDTYLPISGDPIAPNFKFSKLVTITYPSGGKLKSLLDGQNKTVSFTEYSATNPSVKKLMDDINSQLRIYTQAVTTITSLQVNYHTTVMGGSVHTDIEYTIELIPTLSNYILNKGQGDSPTVLDASWVTFDEKAPIVISSQYGDLDVNHLIDFIKLQLPDVYNNIKGTDAETALQQNLIDSSNLLRINPLDRWDSLFDPAYSLTPTLPHNQAGIVVHVTTFATGFDSSIQKDRSTRIGGAEFVSDADYHLDITEKPDTGIFNVQGHANSYNLQGRWAFSTTINPIIMGTGGPVPWFEQVNGWAWVGVVSSAVIGFWIFYFRRFRR